MSAKRKPLSLSPEKFTTQALPDPVRVVSSPILDTRPNAFQDSKAMPSSRAGRVQVVCWVTPEQRTELKVIAARSQRTVDEMLVSMIDTLIASKGE